MNGLRKAATPFRRVEGPLAASFGRIGFALALLLLVSLAAAPDTLRGSTLLTMLPFASMLAIAAIGQTIVVQHGGLDLSVAGTVSLSAAVVTKGAQEFGGTPAAIGVAFGAAVAMGLLNGVLVARLAITPLIATLGVNALAIGVVLTVTGGVPTAAPQALTRIAIERTLGVPNTMIAALAVLTLAGVVLQRTVLGRRHVAVGVSTVAARNAGLRVDTYRIAPYVVAALCYAIAGTLIAGFQQSPGLSVGDPYLISTVAVVVLAGTPLTGGRASVVATALAALFLTQLNQLVLSVGAPTAVQYLIQAAVIAAGVAARELTVLQRAADRVRTRRREPPAAGPPSSHSPSFEGAES
ncbi:ABC transporter permease [Actinomadura viridis]|uniref:Autoinducer 2 import system permease protein LsrD n=1 Tax=Actinomadura viridis TaxID=58110 RepID=A0A931GGP1_9ACTN|nr:ABC transporter permease [Actinomadura viridis]MBG6085997.1 ribose transport system permease protein [Actinomadura viridis]